MYKKMYFLLLLTYLSVSMQFDALILVNISFTGQCNQDIKWHQVKWFIWTPVCLKQTSKNPVLFIESPLAAESNGWIIILMQRLMGISVLLCIYALFVKVEWILICSFKLLCWTLSIVMQIKANKLIAHCSWWNKPLKSTMVD